MEENSSILDKILHSKEQEEIEHFRPQEIVESLLKYCSQREKDVIRRRFGLLGNRKETLEDIGLSYKVTRERIRQIETIALKKIIAQKGIQDLVDPVAKTISTVLQKNGGIMRQDLVLTELLHATGDTEDNQASTLFLMEKILTAHCVHITETAQLYESWKLPTAQLPFIQNTTAQLIETISHFNKPLKSKSIIEEFQKTQYYTDHAYQLTPDALISYLEISKRIAKNPFDEYGLSEWGSVQPKRMNDKIYLVLKKHGKPAHFTEITHMINELKFDDRKAYPPTIHNELILNDQYVLVGRGIYALKEWGYKAGVVSDVIAAILQKAAKPLTRQEIVNEVLQQRMVKKNTIHLALTDKHRFYKTKEGAYTLAPQQ